MKFAIGAWAMLAGFIAGAGNCLAAELLMFDDPSCVWCRRWEAEIGKSYALTPEGREAPLRRIHIGKQGEAGVAFASPITVTPTFVLVENEQEVGRIAGYVGKDFFYPMLDELIRKIPPPAPSSRPALRSTMCIPGLPTSPGMARLQYHSGRPSGDSCNVKAHC